MLFKSPSLPFPTTASSYHTTMKYLVGKANQSGEALANQYKILRESVNTCIMQVSSTVEINDAVRSLTICSISHFCCFPLAVSFVKNKESCYELQNVSLYRDLMDIKQLWARWLDTGQTSIIPLASAVPPSSGSKIEIWLAVWSLTPYWNTFRIWTVSLLRVVPCGPFLVYQVLRYHYVDKEEFEFIQRSTSCFLLMT